MREILPERVSVCYSMKANPFLTGELAEAADDIEVCSFGELAICRRLHIPPEKIVLSGVNKGREDLLRVLQEYGNRITYTAESLAQWEILDGWALEHQVNLSVLPRLTNGSQFGMDREEIESILAQQAQRRRAWEQEEGVFDLSPSEPGAMPHGRMKTTPARAGAEVSGIHFFAGTQKKNMKRDEDELLMLDECLSGWKEAFGFVPERLEYGPGMSVDYYGSEQADRQKEEQDLWALFAALSSMKYQGRVVLEFGRRIAASCGTYVTEVAEVKQRRMEDGTVNHFAIVGGGIHQITYYGQMMGMKIPPVYVLEQAGGGNERAAGVLPAGAGSSSAGEDDRMRWSVFGSLCSMNDVLLRDVPLGELHAGDHLVFGRCGAYSPTEGIALFLSRDLPAVFLYDRSRGARLVRRNTPADSWNTPQEITED